MPNDPTAGLPGAESKLLKLFDAEARAALLAQCERLTAEAGTVFCQEGAAGDDVFVVLSGRVRVTVDDFGNERLLATLEAGDFFGEMAFLTNHRRNATVTAEATTELLRIPHEALRPLLEKNSIAKTVLNKVAVQRAAALVGEAA